MIESATWTNIHNGQVIAFNANDTPFNTFTTEVEWRQDEMAKPQEHGSIPGFPYLGARLFHADGDILKASSAEYITKRRDLVRAVMPSARYGNKIVGTLQILFTGMPETVQALCSLDGYPELPMEGLGPAHGAYQINWKSYDPRLYGLAQLSATANISGTSNTGRAYAKTYPKQYLNPTAVTGDVILTNSGDIEVYPTVDILGPATFPALTLLSPAPQMRIEFGNLVVAAGETITINFENRTATSSLGRDVYYTLTSREWWALDVGNSTVRFSAFSASAPAQATFKWRNAYML